MYFTTPKNKQSFILENPGEELAVRGRGSDHWLLAAVSILMVAGILAVYSSIAYFAESHSTTAFNLVFGHMIKLGIAIAVLVIFSKIPYQKVALISKYALLMSWIFLIFVMFYGNEVFGARRHLNVGGFSFQPSSFATVALLIHLCVMLVNKQSYITSFSRTFLPMMFWVGITCLLVGLEDFSSAALILSISLLIMFIGRVSVIHLGGLVVIGALGAAFLLSQSAERQSRITNYIEQVIHIKSDGFALNAGYQAQQAHIAIAKGGLLGVGIGKSTQRDFLPAPYNDFIFAIITEEYGLAGAGLILLAFMLILLRGVVFIAQSAPDMLGSLIAMACTLTIVAYGLVNAAVATGLFPVTGLPMPFVSYGGTSMLFAGMMIGILMNISRQCKEEVPA